MYLAFQWNFNLLWHFFKNAYKQLRKLKKVYKRVQTFANVYKWLQTCKNVYECVQTFTNVCERWRMFTNVYKSFRTFETISYFSEQKLKLWISLKNFFHIRQSLFNTKSVPKHHKIQSTPNISCHSHKKILILFCFFLLGNREHK